MEIGIATSTFYSYEEIMGWGEPFPNDERKVIENSKTEVENKEKRGRGECKREKTEGRKRQNERGKRKK